MARSCARLAAETEAKRKLLGESVLDLAVLPYRHLDPLVRPFGVKPALEIVTTRSFETPLTEDGFIAAVRAVMSACFAWRKKRDLEFRAGR